GEGQIGDRGLLAGKRREHAHVFGRERRPVVAAAAAEQEEGGEHSGRGAAHREAMSSGMSWTKDSWRCGLANSACRRACGSTTSTAVEWLTVYPSPIGCFSNQMPSGSVSARSFSSLPVTPTVPGPK